MSRFASFALVLLLLPACPTEEEPGPAPQPGEFRAGAAHLPLPFPLGMGVAGDLALGEEGVGSPYSRLFPGTRTIHGHPSVKALYLSRGEGFEAVFVRVDTIAAVQQLRDAVVVELRGRIGRDLDEALVVAATHTHSGPGRFIQSDLLQAITDYFFPQWYDRMVDAVADAVEQAFLDLEPAELGWTTAAAPEAQEDRRCEDGEEYGNPTVPIVVVRKGGEVDAVLISFAAHGTVLGNDDFIMSAQQHGAIEEKIEQAFPGEVTAIHFAAWGGDMAPGNPGAPGAGISDKPHWADRFERLGLYLALQVVPAAEAAPTSATPTIEAETVRYPIDRSTIGYGFGEFQYLYGGVYCESEPGCEGPPERQEGLDAECAAFPESDPAPMQSMFTVGNVGGLHFATWGGESGTRLAEGAIERMKAHSGADEVLFVGYGNDYLGYQLEEEDWWYGGYESSGGMWGPKQGEYMRDRLIEAYRFWLDGAALSYTEPGPARIFDTSGAGAWEPEEALDVGTVVEQPAAELPSDGTATFTVNGSEPWVGRPLAHLQVEEGGSWTDLLWRGGRSVDSDSYAYWVDLATAPDYRDVDSPAAREFRWTFHFPITRRDPGYAPLSGTYRFRVEIPLPEGGVTEATSEPFRVP